MNRSPSLLGNSRHNCKQIGMSDDAMPILRCEWCGYSLVGREPEPPCKANPEALRAERASILAAGDGRDLASRADELRVDEIDALLKRADS